MPRNINLEGDQLLDQQLKQIIRQIQDSPPKSSQRRRLIDKLLGIIQTSSRLSYPYRDSFKGEYYFYLRNQAISKTFEYITRLL